MKPVVITLLGGPADLQRHTLSNNPPPVYIVPVAPVDLSMRHEQLASKELHLEIAKYHTVRLQTRLGDDIFIGIYEEDERERYG